MVFLINQRETMTDLIIIGLIVVKTLMRIPLYKTTKKGKFCSLDILIF